MQGMHVNEQKMTDHLRVDHYGDFWLTDAVRPAPSLPVVPREGYRIETYRDPKAKFEVPVLVAAVSRERLFDVFMELLDPLGEVVDVVLETSHNRDASGHTDLYREHIDVPVFKSMLWDFEDLLMNDGCTGIAVLNPSIPQEVQFDEHKLLIVYGKPLAAYEAVFERFGVRADSQIKFLTEAEHVHSSSDKFAQRFEELTMSLGMDSGSYSS